MPDAPPPNDRRDPSADAPGAAPKPEGHAGGFTLDLSSGPSSSQPDAWRRKRKRASPILTKIVDLTAPRLEPPASEKSAPKARVKPQVHACKPPREKRCQDPRGHGKKPGGATLADLLDEETLARLRGEE